MYKLYTDKTETLEAKVKVTGAPTGKIRCRLFAESDQWTLSFSGNVSKDGTCRVDIPAVSHILKEGQSGKLFLEVIADDTVFTVWEDSFIVEVHKSVKLESVEIKQSTDNKPKVSIVESKVKKDKFNTLPISRKLCKFLLKENIDIKELKNRKLETALIVGGFLENNNIPQEHYSSVITESVNILSKIKK